MGSIVRNRIAESIPEGKSRAQLAQEVGISRVHMQRIISGRQLPSIEIALTISVVLQKPVGSLFQLNPDWEGKRKGTRGKTKTG